METLIAGVKRTEGFIIRMHFHHGQWSMVSISSLDAAPDMSSFPGHSVALTILYRHSEAMGFSSVYSSHDAIER